MMDRNLEEMQEIKEKQEREDCLNPAGAEVVLCPCCGQYTFSGDNTFEICEICGWENNRVQTKSPDFAGGANHMSLNEARESFRAGKQVR